MTASFEADPKDACSQLFTKRYDEFIFGNDTVTAFGPDWDPPNALTAKPVHPAS
jgi:hypothetical protein